MDVTLKITGEDLLPTLSKAIQEPVFARSFRGEPLNWQLVDAGTGPDVDNLPAVADCPSVFLLQIHNKSEISNVLDRLRALEKKLTMSSNISPEALLGLSPVLLVLNSKTSLQGMSDLPDVISDWVFAPLVLDDLVRRILMALKNRRMLQQRISFGPVVLSPITRTMSSGERSMRLSPSEFALAEFFFSQMGSVVVNDTLIKFFESQEKSTQPNNIRVAIFQLRLKLESLTSSQVTLSNIYKKGYCLRLKSPRYAPTINRLQFPLKA